MKRIQLQWYIFHNIRKVNTKTKQKINNSHSLEPENVNVWKYFNL